MTTTNYRDPSTLEEAMVEVRHLRKIELRVEKLRAELAAQTKAADHWMGEANRDHNELASIRQQEPALEITKTIGGVEWRWLKGLNTNNFKVGDKLYLAADAQAVPTWTDADIAKMHRLAEALDSDEPVQAGAQPVPEAKLLGYVNKQYGYGIYDTDGPGRMAVYTLAAAPVQGGAQAEQGLFGYVSEHNCQGPFQYQFHKDTRSIYTDNCKSITPVYVAAPVQAGAQERKPLTLDYIDQHIGADEGDREAVVALVREVEAAHDIKEQP